MADDRSRRILRAEATLLRVPIFALAIKGSASLDGFEFRHSRRRGERTVESVIRTERDEKTPYPGPLSRRVHMAVLSMVTERGFPFENPVAWTWRELCRRMGLPNSGRRDAELKAALRATWGLKIFGMAAVDGQGRARESWRRLYAECEFLNEHRADGSVADANRLWLAPWYLDSLNALHSAPVDYALWKRLEQVGPLASRLYEYLIPAFYKREALEVAYDRLAAAMPVVAESRRSHAVRQFTPALRALEAEGILAGSGWDAMKGTGRPKLLLTRGPRLAPSGPGVATETGTGTDTAGAASALDSGPDPEAPARLANEFYRILGKDHRPLRSDLAVARDLIDRYGTVEARERLPDAVRRLKARFRNAETMGALVRYFEESCRESRRRREETARTGDPARRPVPDPDDDPRQDDDRRRVFWAALSEPQRQAIRDAVLADHPPFRRVPALLDAACLQRLTLDEPGVADRATERPQSGS
jgi:hypothetical protein